jgi:membrane associated rhomboid family serine protease
VFIPPPAPTEEPPPPEARPDEPPAHRAERQSPPPLRSLHRYPVTAAVGLAAVGVSVAWWAGFDVEPLLLDVRGWRGQPWRVLTSALPHVGLLHLVFNLYWLWVFGTRLEEALGSAATAALMGVLAVGSAAAQYAVSEPGVGLSGVGYGLFGLLGVAGRRDPRFAGVVDGRIVALFVGWAVACVALTEVGACG